MHEGNWTCSSCGSAITELPFKPKSENNLLCRECHAKKREKNGGSGGGQKQMHEGNWKCADCGNAITKLPFKPRETGNLRCLECFKKSKQ